jgi:conjugal transfer pilus assembly protein TraE
MKHTDFTQKWLGLQDSNKFLKIVCGFLLFVNLILVIGVLNTEKLVVLIPQGLSEQADIAQNKASEGYKKSWGMYAATLLGNITPENADFILESLNDMVTPDIKLLLNDQVRNDLETLKEEKVSSTFEIKKVSYEPETDKVFVTGKHWITGVGAKSGSSGQTFEFKIDIKNYSPIISHLALYEGEAKIVAVVKREAAKQQTKKDQEKAK